MATASIDLTPPDLRAVARFAAACATPALAIFERDRPGDPHPRAAVAAAQAFADGAKRAKVLRDTAWAAHRAALDARDAGNLAARDAARAAGHAAGAAFLHPLAKGTQVGHILAAAAHTARAFELDAGGDPAVAADLLERSRRLADRTVIDVLRRYPAAPPGYGRPGELMRQLDAALRGVPR